jgi:hypothetical protein
MSGLFLWIDRVQPYDEGGFNYMKGLLEFADSGFTDDEFVIKTHNIVKFGCHAPPCQNSGCLCSPTCADTSSESDDTGFMTKAYRTYTEVDLWSFPTSLGGSLMPSPSPTKCTSDCTPQPSYSPLNPTGTPSASPFIEPTLAPTYSPTSLIDQRLSYFLHVKTILEYRKEQIVKEIFTTPGTPVYTFDGFLDALEDVSTNAPDGLIFYLGQDANSNLVRRRTSVLWMALLHVIYLFMNTHDQPILIQYSCKSSPHTTGPWNCKYSSFSRTCHNKR